MILWYHNQGETLTNKQKKDNEMKYILVFIFFGIVIFGCMRACEMGYKQLDDYAVEHNCKIDYNGLCYTKEQKPWLFK